MARTTIQFTYKDTDYTLGYTLDSINQMQQNGFIFDEIGTKTTLRTQELFYGAFIANHRGIKRKLVDEIYKNLANKDELIKALMEIYNEAGEALLEEGNVSWTKSE